MSTASRKISTSGLRSCTKKEEIKQSTNAPSLNFRIRYALSFARFVADDSDLKLMLSLESGDQLDHLDVRLRLRAHEARKLTACKWTFFIEDHSAQIFFKRHPSLFVRFKVQGMPFLHLAPLHLEMFCRSSAFIMVPS